ncbi:SpoIIE family protein phosphatase [Nocardiopsis sp. NPDC055824]
MAWAQAGHPAPLLFRDGTGHTLRRPEGVLLGATTGAVYGEAETRLLPGDLLVLHTDGLTRRGDRGAGPSREGLSGPVPVRCRRGRCPAPGRPAG